MSNNNFQNYKYTVANRNGFTLSEALRLWKTKYEQDFRDFEKDVIKHPGLYEFRDFVKEVWDDIKPVTVEEALQQPTTEGRRTYFESIGIEKIFKALDPKLLDKQVIKKKRMRWDDNNDPYEYEFEDVYELYEIEGTKLFEIDRWGNVPNPVFAVRCWCTTTNREYWLYVNRQAATGQSWGGENLKYDAIRAIAWTIRINVSKPEKIYRQGDIIVAKLGEQSVETVSTTHLTKEDYLRLMYSET